MTLARRSVSGLADDDLPAAVEAVMRAGPYRPKWDTVRPITRDGQVIRTTWLGRTIGRA